MKEALRAHYIQIIIIALVLLLFMANAAGLLEINVTSGSVVSFRSLISGPDTGLLSHTLVSAEFLVLLVTGILLAVFLPLLSPVKASILVAASILPAVLLGIVGQDGQSRIPMEYSLLTILVLFSTNVLISYFRETHSRQKIIEAFGQYVPPQIVSEISRNPKQIDMEGDARHLSVFFCDIQNFTGTAEQLNPKQLAALLNEYLSSMSETLFEYGATIDKFIGDAIMAFWGAPVEQPDHAQRSVLASIALHKKVIELSKQFLKKGWPGPRLGIGINSGMMNVGNMGSRYRIAYTVVGDAVNLASRLESLTRLYNVPTIISESTMQQCKGIYFRELDAVYVKGKHKSTRIFQPVCMQDEVNNTLHRQMKDHKKGIEYYYKGRWEDAMAVFRQLEMELDEDPYYPVILSRINEKSKRK